MLACRIAEAFRAAGRPAAAWVPTEEQHPDTVAARRFRELPGLLARLAKCTVLLVGLHPDDDLAQCQVDSAARHHSWYLLWERLGRRDPEDVPVGLGGVDRLGDRILTLNTHYVQGIERITGAGRSGVIPPPIPAPCFQAFARGPRQNSDFILSVGRLSEAKGIPRLVDLCGRRGLLTGGRRLVIATPGAEPVSSLPPAQHVERVQLGALSERIDLMRRANAVIFPAQSDHLPQALLECMAVGAPIVATDIPGHTEVIVDGHTGRLVDARLQNLGQILKEAATDPSVDRMRFKCARVCSSPLFIRGLRPRLASRRARRDQMRLVQDVALARGGAERVLSAALASGLFDQVLLGLDESDLPDKLVRTALRSFASASTLDHTALLRHILVTCLDHAPLCGKSIVFHHHAGLLFRHEHPPGVYMHTVTRVLWEPERVPWELPAAVGLQDYLVERECSTVEDAVVVATNSNYTACRIERIFGRTATVIYPPVSLWRTRPKPKPSLEGIEDFVLCISRLSDGKGLELLRACAELDPRPYVLVGAGRLLSSLSQVVPENLHLVGDLDDAELRWLIARAAVVAAPAVEDFGLSTAEASCEGTPVVVPDLGGQLEHVDERLGVVFPRSGTAGNLAAAIDRARGMRVPSHAIRQVREKFGTARFSVALRRMAESVERR